MKREWREVSYMDLRVGDIVAPGDDYSHQGEVTAYVAPEGEIRSAMHRIGRAMVSTAPEHDVLVLAFVPVNG